MKNPDYEKGLALFKAKHPAVNLKLIDEMNHLAPDLADIIIAHGVYDIWERKTPHLTPQEKEIASFAALVDQQNQPEIKAHAFTSLKLGISKQRILELLAFLTLYCGVPKIVIAYKCVKEAFDEFDSPKRG